MANVLLFSENNLNFFIYFDEIMVNEKKYSFMEALELIKNEENKSNFLAYFGIHDKNSDEQMANLHSVLFFIFLL